MFKNSLVIIVNSTWMNTCLGIMKNEPEVVHWIKQKGIDTNPLDLFQFTACSLSISTEYGRPQKPYWESITLIKKSFHRLAPFFSVTKVDAINICWLCVVKGSILCVSYDMEKKILFVYCHLADYPGGKVSYGDALANNKTNNCCSPFAAKTALSLSHHHSETNSLSLCF